MPAFVHCLILAIACYHSLTKAADLLRPCLYTVPSPSFYALCGVILTRMSFSQQSLDTHCLTQKYISSRDGEMTTFLPTQSCKIVMVGFATSLAVSQHLPLRVTA